MSQPQTPQGRLDPAAAVGPQLYRLLRERIIRNDLRAGTRISEAEIAAGYSISRQPVREAFIKLAEEGLLDVRPQRGTFVRRIAQEAVTDARFVREAIEADIVRIVAENADKQAIGRLAEELRQQQAATEQGAAFLALDDRFHRTLAELAGKSRIWDMLEGLKSQMDRVRLLSIATFPARKLVAQHEAIVEAIARHDPDVAERAMRAHLREILSDLPVIAARNPEYFETLPSPP